MVYLFFLIRPGGFSQIYKFRLVPPDAVGQTDRFEAKIVGGFGLKRHLFNRRNLLIAARKRQLQLGSPVFEHINDKFGGILVVAASLIH